MCHYDVGLQLYRAGSVKESAETAEATRESICNSNPAEAGNSILALTKSKDSNDATLKRDVHIEPLVSSATEKLTPDQFVHPCNSARG
jgi:hypothetical protein